MAGDLLDNRGRGEAGWELPSIHPEGRKFGVISVGISLIFLLLLGLVDHRLANAGAVRRGIRVFPRSRAGGSATRAISHISRRRNGIAD